MCEQSYHVESVLQKMQSSLACRICLDLLSNPMTTKCGHSFCKDCLDRLLQGVRGSVPCPLCITSITRRSVKQNKKIIDFVNGVRNIIKSIKEDCGFQEPNKNKSTSTAASASSIPNEETKFDQEMPIRRGTRKREQVSLFVHELPPAKRPIRLKNCSGLSNSDLKPEMNSLTTTSIADSKAAKDILTTENKSETLPLIPDDKEKGHSSKDEMSVLPSQSPTGPSVSETQFGKVEQWLSKNQSLNKHLTSQEETSDHEDIAPTQIFCRDREKSVPGGSEAKEIEPGNKPRVLSQTSTVIFNYDDLTTKDDALHQLNVPGPSSECFQDSNMEEEFTKEETGSMMSEKENKKNGLISLSNEKRRGMKRILSEPNKINPTQKINLRGVSNDFEAGHAILTFQDILKEEEDNDFVLENTKSKIGPALLQKATLGKTLDTSLTQQPNSKGHNIRFTSEIKTKLLETGKPGKLMAKSKSKKSPGWSRVKGARKDLRSKHTSLNIKGGEQINPSESKLESSKTPLELSQESVVVIEEDQSPLNETNLSVTEEKKERFKKLRSIVSTLKTKSDAKHSNSFKWKAKTFISGAKRKETVSELDAEKVDHPREIYKTLEKSPINRMIEKVEECNVDLKKKNVESPSKMQDTNVPSEENLLESCNAPQRETCVEEVLAPEHEQDFINELDEVELECDAPIEPNAPPERTVNEDRGDGSSRGSPMSSRGKGMMVPFYSVGNIQERGSGQSSDNSRKDGCYHSIPCELFQALTKYSSYLTSSYSQSRCCSDPTLGNALTHPSAASQHLQPSPSASPRRSKQKTDQNTEGSYVPESCPSQIQQDVAVMFPDSIPGTSLNLKNYNNSNPQDNDASSFKDECQSPFKGSAKPGTVKYVATIGEKEASQNSQLSTSLLGKVCSPSKSSFHNQVLPTSLSRRNITDPLNPLLKETLKSNSTVDLISALSSSDKILNKNSYSSAPDKTATHSQRFLSPYKKSNNTKTSSPFTSKKISSPSTPSKSSSSPSTSNRKKASLKESSPSQTSSSQSPITFKRSRRAQPLDSSSSEDEFSGMGRSGKKKKRLSRLDSPSSGANKPDSEETRDFERYDQNVWHYYKMKEEEEEEERQKGSLEDVGEKNVELVEIVQSDDDMIPGTAEVLKNIESDMAVIRELREKKMLENQHANTIDIYSQSSVATTSTMNDMSESTRDLFRKCNRSLNLAEHILNEPASQEEKSEGNSKGKDITWVQTQEEDTANASHSSMFSTQSLVISTQQKNKVENEVKALRSKISVLESEMKKATSHSETKETPTDSKLQITEHLKAKSKELEHDSDLDSEELFKSMPQSCDVDQSAVAIKETKNSTSNRERQPITLICSGLSQSEMMKVQTFVNAVCGSDAKFHQKWTEGTTHVVVKTNSEGATERTLKYLSGVANGCWIVSLAWVIDCLSLQMLLPEDEYEALDYTCEPGPCRSRSISTPIFNGYQFCLLPPFEDLTVEEISTLTRTCGGVVVKRFNDTKSGLKLVIMNSEDSMVSGSSALSGVRKRNKVAVTIDWLIECIGMCSLVSIRPYVIGSPSPKEIAGSGIPESLMFETQQLV